MRAQIPGAPRGRELAVASGGTALAALVFLFAGILSAQVSLTIGLALVAYALMVLAIAWSGWRGRRWAVGAMVFVALLHAAVSASMAPRQHFYWALLVVAVVTLVAAARLHLGDLRDQG